MKFINDIVEFDFNRVCEDCDDDECIGDCCICINEYCEGECRGVVDNYDYCYCTDPESTCYCDHYYIVATSDNTHIVFITCDLNTAKKFYVDGDYASSGHKLYCAYLDTEIPDELEHIRNVETIYTPWWSPSMELFGIFSGSTLKYLTSSPYHAKRFMADKLDKQLVCKIVKTNQVASRMK
jgi:hypothetical protein